MRWNEKPFEIPKPHLWFAWYPVKLTASGVTVWGERIWRKAVTLDSKRHFVYSDTEAGCDSERLAKAYCENVLGMKFDDCKVATLVQKDTP